MKKKGWERKTLGSLCNIQLGKTPFRKNAKFWDIEKNSGNVWLSIRDLKHGEFVTESSEQITDLAAKNIIKIPKGTIMVSFKLTLGRVSFAGKDLYTNEAIASLLNLSNEINIEYLFYYFSFFDWNKATDGDIKLKGRTLNKQKLQELDIILPPLKEQEEIVKKLDKGFELIDRLKENAEKNLENAKELFQSALREELSPKKGWETKKLGEVCEVINGYAFSSKDFNQDNAVKSIKITNVGVNEFINDTSNFLPSNFLEDKKDVIIKENDIVIALTRTIIKAGVKVAIVPKDYNNSLLNQRVAAIRIDNKIVFTNFVYYYLSSDIVYDYILSNVNVLMQPNLSINDLKNMPFPYISIVEQEVIVSKLDKIKAMCEELEENYKKSLVLCEELKQGLLREVFED